MLAGERAWPRLGAVRRIHRPIRGLGVARRRPPAVSRQIRVAGRGERRTGNRGGRCADWMRSTSVNLDQRLIELDGTPNKSRLGANAILGVSMAAASAAAAALGKPLFDYLGHGEGTLLPLPEIQIVGGGAHANWRTDVQDFLLIATGRETYDEVAGNHARCLSCGGRPAENAVASILDWRTKAAIGPSSPATRRFSSFSCKRSSTPVTRRGARPRSRWTSPPATCTIRRPGDIDSVGKAASTVRRSSAELMRRLVRALPGDLDRRSDGRHRLGRLES